MIVDITEESLGRIQNPALASYAAIYLGIYRDFMAQVTATGISIAGDEEQTETQEYLDRLRQKGAIFRNHGRSIYLNNISPACVACQKGIGSATFFISLQCHRDCYYCFNPNQVDYDLYQHRQRDLVGELFEISESGARVNHTALTGGEPLLHKDETVAYFTVANRLFPDAYHRLYTSGDHIEEAILARLRDAGLREIRFSIRMHDLAKGQRYTLDRIALARRYIPVVMVEMPILPGTAAEMKGILNELDRLDIHSINLLEFCYPFNNAGEFNRRSFEVRRRPYTTLYNYWYAGGVPIAGSEVACLALLEYALERGLKLGIHYCSLENKLTGQNYQQNHGKPIPKTAYFSEDDYLLKSAKVFGRDINPVLRALRGNGYRDFQRNGRHNYLEFHVSQIPALADLDVEIGVSTATLEMRQGEQVVRELKVDLTTPDTFEFDRDV